VREPNISVGIDIGSTKIITCVGKFDEGGVDIIALSTSENQGIRKGVIVDIDETVSAISQALEEAEKMAGLSIKSAIVGITGPFIECEQSHGVIAIPRPDGEITEDDARRVIEMAKSVPSRPNRINIHTLPQNYIIDGTEIIKDPIGMTGIRLEVATNIISASSNAIKSLNKAAEQAGLSGTEIVFSPLATAKILLSKRQMDIGVLLIDIGASSSSYIVYEEGEMATCGVVPVGSMHITNDIAIGLRTNLDLADKIKLKFGFATPDKIADKEEIDLSKLDENETGRAELKYVSEIIEARLTEIYLMIKDNLIKANCNEALPAGVVLTGGGAKIGDIIEMTKDNMRLPVAMGKPNIEISGLIDKLEDPIYSTSIGLMLWGRDKISSNNSFGLDTLPGIGNVVSKVKSLFKHIIP
jgi:cell division protein FtsA